MICVDASVAAKWVLPEDDSDRALALYSWAVAAGGIVAPALLPVEVANAIWRRVARGRLTRVEADEALAIFLSFGVDIAAPAGLYEEAFALAGRFARPTVYDMVYVALAGIAACDLWTADRALLNVLGGALPFVKDLASFRRTA